MTPTASTGAKRPIRTMDVPFRQLTGRNDDFVSDGAYESIWEADLLHLPVDTERDLRRRTGTR
ncbi:hypothetical protein GCM10010206_11020 [Streptomyces cinerochromogenes]|nr:hypothetical protein GCM10010206_11020 [Streptomyces cinerochromogenes]